MNKEKESAEWESLHRSLRALPDRKAPPNLGARVRRAIQARALLPWWQRPLSDWPRLLRVFAVVFGTALSLGIVWFGAALLGDWMGTASQWVVSSLNPLLGTLGQVIGALARAIGALLGKATGGVWVGVGLAGALVYASGIGIGTVFWKVANHRL